MAESAASDSPSSQSSQSKTTIILALIAAAQAIILALITTGTLNVGRQAAAQPAPQQPTRITGQLIEFRNSSVENCIRTMQTELSRQRFVYSNDQDDLLIMRRDASSALLWCRSDGLFVAVAGSDPRVTQDTAAFIRSVALDANLAAAAPAEASGPQQ